MTEVSDRPRWYLRYDGKTYAFDPKTQLTVGVLRQIKSWFGPELGRYVTFMAAFAEMDPEAVSCALWVASKAAGDTDVPEPNAMEDFAIGELIERFVPAGTPSEEEGEPTTGAQTPTSTETPTSSV